MKVTLPFQWNKIGKDRLVLLLLFGLLLLVVVIPVDTVEQATKQNTEMEIMESEQSSGQKSILAGNKSKVSATSDSGLMEPYSESTQYAEWIAKKLEEVLSVTDGVGKVKVLVTLKNSTEKVVEKDNPNERKNVYETDSEGGSRNTMELSNEITTVYTVDENGNQVPLIVSENAPKIEGILVAAQGGGNETIKVHIIEAIEALFGIEPHKIKVVKMKQD